MAEFRLIYTPASTSRFNNCIYRLVSLIVIRSLILADITLPTSNLSYQKSYMFVCQIVTVCQPINVKSAGEIQMEGEEQTDKRELQEARWLVVKNMLDAFPKLRKRVTKYLMKR